MTLYHFSEDASIESFEPRWHEREQRALVWAIDDEHAPLFWFPRDCPRCTWWAAGVPRVHAVEWDWFERIRDCRLSAYVLPQGPFEALPVAGGYYVSEQAVVPIERQDVGPLLDRHREAGIELRFVANLWPTWDEVVESGRFQFSGCRLDNARPRPSS